MADSSTCSVLFFFGGTTCACANDLAACVWCGSGSARKAVSPSAVNATAASVMVRRRNIEKPVVMHAPCSRAIIARVSDMICRARALLEIRKNPP
jgi:hypothetical protein